MERLGERMADLLRQAGTGDRAELEARERAEAELGLEIDRHLESLRQGAAAADLALKRAEADRRVLDEFRAAGEAEAAPLARKAAMDSQRSILERARRASTLVEAEENLTRRRGELEKREREKAKAALRAAETDLEAGVRQDEEARAGRDRLAASVEEKRRRREEMSRTALGGDAHRAAVEKGETMLKAATELAEAQTSLAAAQAERERQTVREAEGALALARASEELEALTRAWVAAQSAVLAAGLKPGQPCPVCGSTEHPAPAQAAGEVPGEWELEAKRAELREREVGYRRLGQGLSQTKSEAAGLAATVKSLEPLAGEAAGPVGRERVEAALAEARAAVETARQAREGLAVVEGEMADLEKRLAEAERLATEAAERRRQAEVAAGGARSATAERERHVPADLREPGALETAVAGAGRALTALDAARKEAEERLAGCTQRAAAAVEVAAGAARAAVEAAKTAEAERERFAGLLQAAGFVTEGERAGGRLRPPVPDEPRALRPAGRGRTGRPAATLSGGESFLASMSLALGLADTVQAYSGGIHLGTIFIDEGFGSLDPEALDLALKVLVDLQRGGRMVGVISHVPELREHVAATIEVSPGRHGSTVRVVAAGS